MVKYGMELQPMSDPTSLPAPVGIPFSGDVEFPFADLYSQSPPPPDEPAPENVEVQTRPNQEAKGGVVRQSTLYNFDPLTGSVSDELAPRSSSLGSATKPKAPPIPPTRRDTLASSSSTSSRASLSYDSPRSPAVPFEPGGVAVSFYTLL